MSPERQNALKQIGGRIVQENELKLEESLDENHRLKNLYKNKVDEQERLHYKYAKSKS